MDNRIKAMTQRDKLDELGRLRNRHVAKLLSYLGEPAPYLETAVKKAFSMFAEDVEANIINSDNGDQQNEEEQMENR